jgi:hypothetical protein
VLAWFVVLGLKLSGNEPQPQPFSLKRRREPELCVLNLLSHGNCTRILLVLKQRGFLPIGKLCGNEPQPQPFSLKRRREPELCVKNFFVAQTFKIQ